jgi:hypothetical protein
VRRHPWIWISEFFARLGVANGSPEVACDLSLPVFGNLPICTGPGAEVHVGANLTGTSGSELRLDPQALIPESVTGPLNSKWLHPYGGVHYHFAKYWTGKAYWDYYGYHE